LIDANYAMEYGSFRKGQITVKSSHKRELDKKIAQYNDVFLSSKVKKVTNQIRALCKMMIKIELRVKISDQIASSNS
jgi:hypothetical protein